VEKFIIFRRKEKAEKQAAKLLEKKEEREKGFVAPKEAKASKGQDKDKEKDRANDKAKMDEAVKKLKALLSPLIHLLSYGPCINSSF
jgi:hypothetical protein